MPARQPVRRKQRRTVRSVRQQPMTPLASTARATAADVPAAASDPLGATANRDVAAGRVARQAPISATRVALAARSADLARLDVIYLRHDLRNVGIIASLMLAIIIGLSFVLH